MSRRVTISAQTGLLVTVLFVAGVCTFRFLEWLFAGNIWLWAALIALPVLFAILTYVIDAATEGGTSGE